MFPFSVDDYPELKKALDDLEEVLREIDNLLPKKVTNKTVQTFTVKNGPDEFDLIKLFEDSGCVVRQDENGHYIATITVKPKDEPDATDH